eukprot:3265643-Rhodomonas_salina.1
MKRFKPESQCVLFAFAFVAQFALSQQQYVGSICAKNGVLKSPFCGSGSYCQGYGDPYQVTGKCVACRSGCPQGTFISAACDILSRKLADRQCLSSPDAVVLGHNCRWEDSQFNNYYPCKRGYWCPPATNDTSYPDRKTAVCRSCQSMTCPLGFRLEENCNVDGSESDTACVEDDECLTGLHNCGDNGVCVNDVYPFRCECAAGFSGD